MKNEKEIQFDNAFISIDCKVLPLLVRRTGGVGKTMSTLAFLQKEYKDQKNLLASNTISIKNL